ncbi:MAG: threonine/serine dehydratase [Anaerolineae bacterium]|nr:threonine/serine dehydratase [Anaerolineae bacterium]
MITLDHIRDAQARIQGIVYRTPLLPYFGSAPDQQLYLKLENLQPTGAFKLRGAYNLIASLSDQERSRGVVAHSSGNHAMAVAYAARAVGTHSTIVMPPHAPEVKQRKTAEFGGNVVLHGSSSQDVAEKAAALAQEHGYVMVEPFNDERIAAGQGTIGLEVLEDIPDLEAMIIPVSGGGLISGIATAIKLSKPSVRIIGVEPEFAADAQASLRSGQIVSFSADQVIRTSAEGLRVMALGDVTWPYIRDYVDDIVTVSEDEIRQAMRHLALDVRVVAEASGAATFAAWLFHRDELPVVKRSVCLISGGNITAELLRDVLA